MKVDLMCDSPNHPILPILQKWAEKNRFANLYDVNKNLKGGDMLFLISCNQVIDKTITDLYTESFVIHESDLPEGRGWSPLVWQVIDGKNDITVTLLRAAKHVDSGDIVRKELLQLDGTELFDEINNKLFKIKLDLINYAINNFQNLEFTPQPNEGISYYPKRHPLNSEINIDKSIVEQINLLRICDPDRYPAFFYYKGTKYNLTLNKSSD